MVKISIVMAYLDRKEQLITTLQTIEASVIKDIEVIIVDDMSQPEHELLDIIYQYPFPILLCRVDRKEWNNPVIPYNIGFSKATGDIIVIQNPEVCHVGDVLSYIVDNLKSNEYMVFSCFASPSFKHNRLLHECIHHKRNITSGFVNAINYDDFRFDPAFYSRAIGKDFSNHDEAYDHFIRESNHTLGNATGICHPANYIRWKGWYNHPTFNDRPLHFLSATYRTNVVSISGFDERYATGYWYDDDDFLKRLKFICVLQNVPPTQVYGVHQYHNQGSHEQVPSQTFVKMMQHNKQLYENCNQASWLSVGKKVISPQYTIFYNCALDKQKIVIAVTTHSTPQTSPQRYNIIKQSLDSLVATCDNIKVIIVVDGCSQQHHELLSNYPFKIIYRSENGGISKAKNTCIKEMINEDFDIGFLADDDMLYRKGWYRLYASAVIKTGIEHLFYYPRHLVHNTVSINFPVKGTILTEYKYGIAGCFMVITPNVINRIGFFKVLPYKYGYEHENFTYRAIHCGHAPCKLDVYGSGHYLRLNDISLNIQSSQYDMEQVQKNEKYATCDLGSYVNGDGLVDNNSAILLTTSRR